MADDDKRVDLDQYFTRAEVKQLIRSLDWALMMDAHEDEPGHPQRLDILANRENLKVARDKLRLSLEEDQKS